MLGLTATALGQALVARQALITRISGLLVLAFALFIAGSLVLKLPLLYQERRFRPMLSRCGPLAAPVAGMGAFRWVKRHYTAITITSACALALPNIDHAGGGRDRKPAWRAWRIRARTMAAMLACALAATACAAGTAAAHQPRATAHQANPTSVALPQIPASGREQVASALYGTVVYGPGQPGAGLPRPLVNPADIISGGPPPDGIPAIDHPRFLRPAQVSFLSASEPVLALQIGADARAYPVQILIWPFLPAAGGFRDRGPAATGPCSATPAPGRSPVRT